MRTIRHLIVPGVIAVMTVCVTSPPVVASPMAPAADSLAASAPLDSLADFVGQLAPVVSSGLLPCVQLQADSPFSRAEQVMFSKENQTAIALLQRQVDPAHPLESLTTIMRSWRLGNAEFRRRKMCGMANISEMILQALVPLAAAGLMPEPIERFARSYIDAADDTAFLLIQKRMPVEREIARQAAALGDSSRYDPEILSHAENWWGRKARAYIVLGLVALHRGQNAQARRAFEVAHQLAPQFPEPSIRLGDLAMQMDSAAALRYYAGAAVGWYSASARRTFEAAFRAGHHGTLAGAEELLDSVYRSVPEYGNPILVDPSRAATLRPRRRILLSYPTALHCTPCTAKDLSVAALQTQYGNAHVIVLSYHFDPPFRPVGFDINRWIKSCEKRDTTLSPGGGYIDEVAIDGRYPQTRTLPPPGAEPGWRAGAIRLYDLLRPIVEARLAAPPSVRIHATATLVGEHVHVAVRIDSLSAAGRVPKLHLVLAEDEIRRPGQEGIRFQRYVVRSIAGDSASEFGIPLPARSQARMEHTFDLRTVSAALRASNSRHGEWGFPSYWNGFQWTWDLPPESYTLDHNHLYVVAFVQDEVTGEVFDVASVPIGR